MKLRGTGVGSMFYGVGNTGLPNPAAAFCEVLPDTSVNVTIGAADIGQGVATVAAAIAAETLGLEFENIHVTWADTQIAPEGGATSASRQTFITGNAVKNACTNAMGELKRTASEFLNVPQEELIFRHREIYSSKDESKKMTYPELMGAMGKNGRLAVGAGYYNPKTTYLNPADMSGVPYEVYSYATCIIEVEVDTDTGEVQLLKCVSAHDVGTPVGVKMCEGQIEGGTAMGTGFVISEKIEIDPKTCAIKNPSLSKYIIESSMDVPEVYPIVVCSDGDAAPYGAKGIGEPALIPSIPATMAAIGNATKHGFLVREGDALERLAAVKKITFDKTGTLTYGTPRVVLVHSALPSLSDHELYRLCAAAERYSEHLLGKA